MTVHYAGEVHRACLVLLSALLIAACGDDSSPGPAATPTPSAAPSGAPWQRTEERAPCDDYDPLRQPFFGDLHVHTRYSADASIFGTKAEPRDAYDFARGGTIMFSDADEQPTRPVHLDRPLDFAAVTDHSEFFGEVDVCTRPDSPVYDIRMCKILRQYEPPDKQFGTIVQWLFPAGIDNPPPSLPFCTMPGVDCDAAAVSVWQEMQAAAEAAYDRSSACRFTSFIGYEHTPSRGGRHLHRNVIFRNHHVPPQAYSQLETASGGVPQGLWSAIEDHCLDAGIGCEAVIIPHNSNLSDGLQFFDPADAAEAQRRQDREPLVEIYQSKGGSECRFDRLAGRGVGTEDELCTFEQLKNSAEIPGQRPPSIDEYPRRNLVRNTLADGLQIEESLGVNPFRFGFIASTDTHDAAPGNTEEPGYEGKDGNNDATPQRQIQGITNNPGGLAAVWAEENSRDALFTALRRRETYATSGTRPVVRFFAGGLADVACGAPDFVARAYQTGTPMGGELGAVRGAASPRFAVLALKDPGSDNIPGTDLQRIQIVKTWLENGASRDRVYDVAGDADNGADVDPATCTARGPGAAELCTVWEDPDFNPDQRALYYARVLENPTCRWSTFVCKAAGVDPLSADCAAQAAAADPAFADCCLSEADDPFLSPLIQERAWTSPVWYRKEGIASVRGGIDFGRGANRDALELEIRLAATPPAIDLAATPATLELVDDDTIYRTTLAGTGFVHQVDGSLTVEVAARGLDLSAADRVDHTVTVQLVIGTY
ncbi:MAG TPA: DUF3604 domain-containing protein, partial [Candidatus Dormibacteraeota bacterium]|nr:DUF3604 domain-containing protein [Candidatus Dormibacteraeota bacterium]